MPRSSHPNLVHFALAVGGFAIGTTEFATMSLVPYFSRDLGISVPAAGHAISAYALGVVLGAPLIAVLAARIARRDLLIGLMIVFAVANGLTGLVPSYHWMLLLRFISGLPHGAYFGVAMLVAASLVGEHQRAQAAARVLMGLTVATIIGVPCAQWLGQAIGWRWGFGIVAMLSQTHGEYWLAGAVSATYALVNAVLSPQISRWVDQRGQTAIALPTTLVSVLAFATLIVAANQHWPAWTLFGSALLAAAMPSIHSCTLTCACAWPSCTNGPCCDRLSCMAMMPITCSPAVTTETDLP